MRLGFIPNCVFSQLVLLIFQFDTINSSFKIIKIIKVQKNKKLLVRKKNENKIKLIKIRKIKKKMFE